MAEKYFVTLAFYVILNRNFNKKQDWEIRKEIFCKFSFLLLSFCLLIASSKDHQGEALYSKKYNQAENGLLLGIVYPFWL